MFKSLVVLVTIFLVSLNTIFADEQDSEWQVLVYGGNQILRVTADGLAETIELPEPAQDIVSGNTGYYVGLSPDERYFAYVTETRDGENFTANLYLADLTSDTCCTAIPLLDDKTWEVINIGAFSPDNRYMIVNAHDGYLVEYDAAIAILDLETAEWVSVIDPNEIFNTNALFFIDWTEAGIEVKPTCFPCGAWADGMTILWDPFAGDLTTDYAYYASAMGSRLANGEIVQTAQDVNLPLSNADAMVGPFNIVQYFTQETIDEPETVYFDPDYLHLIDPEWVIDGQAYLIQDGNMNGSILVWRDGETLTVSSDEMYVLAGTPDGWLMSHIFTGELVQAQWIDGEIVMTDLGTYPAPRLLQIPVLGEALTEPITPQIEDL